MNTLCNKKIYLRYTSVFALLVFLTLLMSCTMFFDEKVSAEITVETPVVATGASARFDVGDSGLVWSMDAARFEWILDSIPNLSLIDKDTAIFNKHGQNASFVPDVTGNYQITLRVTVGTTSDEASATITVKELPGVPTSLTASSTSSSSISLNWNSDPWASSYELRRYKSLQEDSEGVVVYTGSDTSYSNSSLASGTHYEYRVRSINELGKSALSEKVTAATMVQDGDVPGPPAGLQVALTTSSTVTLQWSKISGVTYNIYRSSTSDSSGFVLIATGVDSDTYSDGSLTAGTRYWYKVSGINGTGTGHASDPIATTTLCSPPDAITITAGSPSTSSLVVSWSSSNGATKYRVYRSKVQDGTYTLVAENSSTTYTDTSLDDNTTYYYRITALNESGESLFSSISYRKTHIETRLSVDASPRVGGTVTGSGVFGIGTRQTISASPTAGWEFVSWNDGNTSISRDIVLVVGDNKYTASFQRVLFFEDFESENWQSKTNDFVSPWDVVNDQWQPQFAWSRASTNVPYGGSYTLSSNGTALTYGNSVRTVIKRTIDLRTFTKASMGFEYWMNTEAPNDTFTVRIKRIDIDQSDTPVNKISGTSGGWLHRKVVLDSYCGEQIELAFEFESDESVIQAAPSGVWVDDIKFIAK